MPFTYNNVVLSETEVRTAEELLRAVFSISVDDDLNEFREWLVSRSSGCDDDCDDMLESHADFTDNVQDCFINDSDDYGDITEMLKGQLTILNIINGKLWLYNSKMLTRLRTNEAQDVVVELWRSEFDMHALMENLKRFEKYFRFVYEITPHVSIVMKRYGERRVVKQIIANSLAATEIQDYETAQLLFDAPASFRWKLQNEMQVVILDDADAYICAEVHDPQCSETVIDLDSVEIDWKKETPLI